jgi:tetratricopeptide (TPR) repeat protein
VKLLDFGLAKLLESPSEAESDPRDLAADPDSLTTELTRPDRVAGTAAYMSPEQARGQPIDHRSDLFSLGILLYEMAAGRRPFRKPSSVEILHAIIHEDPPSLGLAGVDLTPEADRIIRKSLEKEPARRYQHADEIVADLKNLRRDLDSGRSTMTTASIPVAPPRRWSRARSAAWILAAAGIAAAAFWLPRAFAPPAPPPGADRRPIGVVGFENLSDRADSGHIGRMLMSLITTDLGESGGLTVVSTARVLSALGHVGQQPDDAFDLSIATDAALTAGIEVMLSGSIAEDGDRLVLTAQLVDVENGTVLRSLKREASSRGDLFRLAGEMAADVRRHMGASAPETGSAFDLAKALTKSTEAYRHFAAGEVALHERRWPDAIQQFSRASREDESFALAWYRLSMAQWWLGTQGDAIVSIEAGLAHVDRLPERWRVIYRSFRDYQTGQPDAAYDALVELVRDSPGIADAWYILGEIRTHFTRYRDRLRSREEFERTLSIDPSFRSVFFHLVDDYVGALDMDGAGSLLARYASENPDDPSLAEAEAALAMAAGDVDGAIDRLEALLASGQGQVLERLAQALIMGGRWDRLIEISATAERQGEMGVTYALGFRGMAWLATGRLKEGIASFKKAVERMDAVPGGRVWLSGLMAYYILVEAQILELSGDLEGALTAARRATDVDPLFASAWGRIALLEARLGREEESARAVAEIERLIRSCPSPQPAFSLHATRAQLALDHGDAGAAAAELALVEAMAPAHRDHQSAWELRARVLAARGDHAGSIEAWDRIFDPIVRYPWARPVTENLALFARARERDAASDHDGAARDLREFLRRWGDADLSIPAVAGARAWLSRPGS